MLLYIVIFWSSLVSFIIPTALAYYYDYWKAKDLAEKESSTPTTEPITSSAHDFFKAVDDAPASGKPAVFEVRCVFGAWMLAMNISVTDRRN